MRVSELEFTTEMRENVWRGHSVQTTSDANRMIGNERVGAFREFRHYVFEIVEVSGEDSGRVANINAPGNRRHITVVNGNS